MLPVIIAPVIGVWGIQYFLNKKWVHSDNINMLFP